MNECKKMFSRNVDNLLLHCVVLSAYQLYDPGGNLFRRDFSVCKMIVSTFILAIHLQIITKPATSPSTSNHYHAVNGRTSHGSLANVMASLQNARSKSRHCAPSIFINRPKMMRYKRQQNRDATARWGFVPSNQTSSFSLRVPNLPPKVAFIFSASYVIYLT